MRLDVVQMRRHTGLDSNAGIIHVATNVGEDLGLETELADCLAICSGERLERNERFPQSSRAHLCATALTLPDL